MITMTTTGLRAAVAIAAAAAVLPVGVSLAHDGEPGVPVHDERHAWVFTDNPAGEPDTFDPSVSCD